MLRDSSESMLQPLSLPASKSTAISFGGGSFICPGDESELTCLVSLQSDKGTAAGDALISFRSSVDRLQLFLGVGSAALF